ncbi:hypothetical protein EVG20_g9011 [Dentipellis fragilis]|uniref:Uncharacterized protein n=1 Tax=Dentipellis fragilis TaxID=205917 RepID=A0A4Y9Y183_9AGAM|nr:hypothetical protein EVG20_g9011 [Dentipellis fragilis]
MRLGSVQGDYSEATLHGLCVAAIAASDDAVSWTRVAPRAAAARTVQCPTDASGIVERDVNTKLRDQRLLYALSPIIRGFSCSRARRPAHRMVTDAQPTSFAQPGASPTTGRRQERRQIPQSEPPVAQCPAETRTRIGRSVPLLPRREPAPSVSSPGRRWLHRHPPRRHRRGPASVSPLPPLPRAQILSNRASLSSSSPALPCLPRARVKISKCETDDISTHIHHFAVLEILPNPDATVPTPWLQGLFELHLDVPFGTTLHALTAASEFSLALDHHGLDQIACPEAHFLSVFDRLPFSSVRHLHLGSLENDWPRLPYSITT